MVYVDYGFATFDLFNNLDMHRNIGLYKPYITLIVHTACVPVCNSMQASIPNYNALQSQTIGYISKFIHQLCCPRTYLRNEKIK